MNGLEAQLFARIKGQDHVIPRVGSVLERGQLGLPPAAQPLGSLLFLGPTGLGKTGSALESLHFFTARLPLSFRYVGFLHLDSAKLFMGMNPANPGDSERSSLILSDVNRSFTARALTRNLNSDRATELAKLGADVVAADLDEIESLKRAFEGAYGAFCVTNFWEHFSPEKELAQATNMAHAAKEAGLEHVIWSTLEDTRQWVPLDDNRMPTLMGKYKVPHFDAKGEANQLFTDMGVPTTFLLTAFYWDNFIHFGMGPKRSPDGTLAITLPMGEKKLPGIAAEDIGKCAYGIFQRGHELIGKTIGLAGEHLTGTEVAAALTQALGEEVRYNDVSAEVYRSLGFPGAEDLGNMFQFKRDFNEIYCGARNVEVARGLNPELQTFDEWLAQNTSRIPLG